METLPAEPVAAPAQDSEDQAYDEQPLLEVLDEADVVDELPPSRKSPNPYNRNQHHVIILSPNHRNGYLNRRVHGGRESEFIYAN